MKGILTIGLLIFSNIFMTLAWYGHLKFGELKGFQKLGLFSIILIHWGIAFFEYIFQGSGKQDQVSGTWWSFFLDST